MQEVQASIKRNALDLEEQVKRSTMPPSLLSKQIAGKGVKGKDTRAAGVGHDFMSQVSSGSGRLNVMEQQVDNLLKEDHPFKHAANTNDTISFL